MKKPVRSLHSRLSHPPGRLRSVLLAGLGLALLPSLEATTINFGSSIDALNICSDGRPLDRGFTFQLGSFAPGFHPTSTNRSQWAANWVPLTDTAGDPLASATVRYDDSFLLRAMGREVYANSFAGTTELSHNQSPFRPGARAFLFAFDGATPATSNQWLVLSDPAWLWPDSSVFSPAQSFSVTESTVALLGRANDTATGAQLVSAPVGEATPRQSYAAWIAGVIPPDFADLATAPWLVDRAADPDGDGLTNLAEFFLGSHPLVAGEAMPVRIRSDADPRLMQISFSRSKSAAAVDGFIERSATFSAWDAPDIEDVIIEDSGDTETITLRVPVLPEEPAGFFRLHVIGD